ncbi:threonine-phosphate decarboxylase CobD [Clostridium nigeriense]|uniref:threonine-phosphate decarboxylase CobD n=1 Tax=Clostridium nigeriense TaxID=1805470 RepID=UPI003D33C161
MSKVVHGGNLDELSRTFKLNKESLIDFSANINPLGINKKVKDAIINALEEVERYPDITYFNLKYGISDFEGVNYEDLVLGNGAAEVIFNLVRSIKPKKVLIPAPTFGEYEEAALSINSSIEYYYLKEENNWIIDEDIINHINEDIDMVFICNPNNPTGILTEKEVIINIAKKALSTNTILAIDESFLDFIRDGENYSVINLLKEYNNIFIIKSMTKLFAIPGIRIGYGMCENKEIIKNMELVSVPWNINILAEKATLEAIKDKEYINRTISYIQKEKNYLYKELNKFNDIKVFNPSVNFIMFKIINNIDLKLELMKENIIIRSCNNYIGLDESYYRVAVRTREENDNLIMALKKVIN